MCSGVQLWTLHCPRQFGFRKHASLHLSCVTGLTLEISTTPKNVFVRVTWPKRLTSGTGYSYDRKWCKNSRRYALTTNRWSRAQERESSHSTRFIPLAICYWVAVGGWDFFPSILWYHLNRNTNTDLYIDHDPSFGHIEYPHQNASNYAQIL